MLVKDIPLLEGLEDLVIVQIHSTPSMHLMREDHTLPFPKATILPNGLEDLVITDQLPRLLQTMGKDRTIPLHKDTPLLHRLQGLEGLIITHSPVLMDLVRKDLSLLLLTVTPLPQGQEDLIIT